MSRSPSFRAVVALVTALVLGAVVVAAGILVHRMFALAQTLPPDAAASLRTLGLMLAGAMFFIAGFASLMAFYVGELLARPLSLLARRMEAIGRGDFRQRVSVAGVAEVEQLARAATEMAAALAERERQALHAERLASLGTLVAGVAHEINNPLTYMRGNQELLVMEIEERLAVQGLAEADRALYEEALRGARSNLRGFDQLARLAASLRVVGRPPKGERVEVDINQLVNGCLVLAHSRFDGGLAAEMELLASKAVRCEPSELSQVFLNLLLNAADAMRGRQGVLALVTEDTEEGVAVHVRDTGPGIPEPVRERLFQPFATTKPHGTGLGLMISKQIVEAHGGRLTYETSPAGTTFTVRLPAIRQAPSTPAARRG